MSKHSTPRRLVAGTGAPATAARLEQLLSERTAELEHARHQTQELFQNMPALSVTTRRGQDGLPIIEDCNRMFPATLGYTRTEIIGRPLGDFYAPASRTAPETQPIDRADERLDGVGRHLLDKYGGVLDTLLYLEPTRARNGAYVGMRATYLDVTEHQREEQRRRDLETRYEAAFAQTLVGVLIVQDGSIVQANAKMAEITGYSPEEQSAFLSLHDMVAEHDRPALADRLLRYGRGERVEGRHVVHIRRKDDVLVPLEIEGGRVLYGGRPAVALVALDISDRIRLLNRLQHTRRLHNIGQLADGVAHSFNNALTAIYGRCEALLDQMSKADPRRHEVEAILKVASDTATLTQRVIAFGHTQPSTPKTLDLNVVVGDTLAVASPLVGQQLSIVTSLEPLLGLVEADAAYLEQALLTLLLHARDRTPVGGVIRVTTANVSADGGSADAPPEGDLVTLAVQDGGPELPSDALATLFEPMQSESGTPAHTGLASVQGLVTRLGGRIAATSSPGQGATITIALPSVAGTAPTQDEREASQPTQQPVLVVEDEDQVRSAVREWLAQAGYRVLEAAGGREALDLLADPKEPVDLILTDVVMPGMNGRQLVEELARTRSELRVIYMSGYPNPVHPFGETDGPTMLQKPFAPRTLLRAVRSVLEADAPASTPPDETPDS